MHLIHMSNAAARIHPFMSVDFYKHQIKSHLCHYLNFDLKTACFFPMQLGCVCGIGLFDFSYIQRQRFSIFIFCLPPSVEWIKIMHTHHWLSIQPINCAQINSTQTNYSTDKMRTTPSPPSTEGTKRKIRFYPRYISEPAIFLGIVYKSKSVALKLQKGNSCSGNHPWKIRLACCYASDDSIRFLQRQLLQFALPPSRQRWALWHFILFSNPILSVQRYGTRFRAKKKEKRKRNPCFQDWIRMTCLYIYDNDE